MRLGRGLEASDAPAVRKIKRDAARENYRFESLIQGIVTSTPFTMRMAVSITELGSTLGRKSRMEAVEMVITKLALPRRTFLRGIGATVALPFLDAMVPAMKAQSSSSGAPRFAAIYFGNGANMFEWTPATDGVGFEMSPTLKPLEAFRDRIAVFTGLDNFQATDQGDVGGQHPRAAPAFMSCDAPEADRRRRRAGGHDDRSDDRRQICRDTKLPSLEVSVDRNDVVGACDHGYACAYMNSHVVEEPDDAAAVGNQPALRLRADVRHRRHRRRASGPRQGRSQHPRRADAGDRRLPPKARHRTTAPSWVSISTPSATSSSASSRPSRPTAISRCPTSRSACPRRSRNTSS